MTPPALLIVEDDEAIRIQLKYALKDEFRLLLAGDRPQAMQAAATHAPGLALIDLGLPPHPDSAEEGLKLLEELSETVRGIKVIILTGNAEHQHAVNAIQAGAFDYHAKPVDLDSLRVVLRRAAYLQGLEREAEAAGNQAADAVQFEDLLGATPAMRSIFDTIERVARTDATVLVEGESGTGKELIANAIHRRSRRHQAPFVAINCGAIPDTLLEAELFGHERGAFTGAHVMRRGKFELAHHGTLFLDEIGELSGLLQVKLLRFLQERSIERIGGRETIHLDLRVIAATNRNLKDQLERALFRDDLYYRLSVVTISVPPLRERREDILLLANTFLRRSCAQHRRKVRFSQEAIRCLLAHSWPGNIRELQNRVERAVIMTRGALIEAVDLAMTAAEAPLESHPLRDRRHDAERQAVIDALIKQKGNISKAAIELGISRPTLHGLLDKHAISARQFR
jgi:two-component system, NtrC family, response regulator